MSLGKSYFLNLLGVDSDYGTATSHHIQVRRRGERTPFAEVIETNGKTILRVGNSYPEPSAIRVVVDDSND